MKYLPQDFARCEGNPLRVECKECKHNVKNSPAHPDVVWQTWIGPWMGHGECPDFVKTDKANE